MENKIGTTENKILQLKNELRNYKSAVNELKILNEIAIAAGKSIDVDQTLKLILDKTVNAVNAEYGTILLISEENNIFKTFIKKEDNSRVGKIPHLREHISGWIFLNKKSLIIENLKRDERIKASKEEKENIKSLISAPIWFENKIIGVTQMINKKSVEDLEIAFTINDLTLLSIISVQAGQLIKNSELQQLNYERKKEAEIAILENEKLQELDRIKTNFFANISHEFRTPLTLISEPIKKILSKHSDEETVKQGSLIRRNTNRLLGLINQLLALSKLEAGKLKLKAAKGNIVSFIKGITMSFESAAERKSISLIVKSSKEEIEVYFDKDMMVKVFSNILSNAFKFTSEGGSITVSVNECHAELVSASSSKHKIPKQVLDNNMKGFIEIKIKDTGIGISEEELPKLFDRFYQVDSSQTREYGGSGLGLALTKELVELHKGTTEVNSKLGKGSEFIIKLPLGRAHLSDEEIVEDEIEEIEKPEFVIDNEEQVQAVTNEMERTDNIDEEKDVILIIEDNKDVREYIKDSLIKFYQVVEAVNGEEGVIKAGQIIPDLIISDIMMPKMDGNELTKRIKKDERTSHIPVILLTAKAEQQSKLEGLETGADDYLIKPFDAKELIIRIKNLINLRKKLQDKYSNGEFSGRTGKKKLSSLDEQFMSKVKEVIEKHLSEEDFSIENFNEEVGMGGVQIYRKLKALTGKSPSRYIRTIRLVKAKKMIIEKEGTISEIAYSVGFSTPQYFTKCFREEFNYLPSDLLN